MPLFAKLKYYKDHLTADYAPYVDKLEAKRLVKELGGDEIMVTPIIRILKDITDISEDDINPDHILKSTHGSGMNISFERKTTAAEVLDKLKEFDKPYVGNSEIHYSFIKPRFFIEKKLNDKYKGITDSAVTFMIRCIKGTPIAIGVRDGDKQNTYDTNGNLIKDREFPFNKKQEDFVRLLDMARKLSKPFEFVRVDMYMGADDNIYFSEFTFTPAGGGQFYSMEKEMEFGRLWN